jgi:hypothetical protein
VSGSSVIYKTFFALNIKNSTNPRDLSIYILNKLEGPCPNFNDILPLVLLNKNMNSFSLQMAETFLSINRKKEYYFINIYKHIFIYKHKKYIHSIKRVSSIFYLSNSLLKLFTPSPVDPRFMKGILGCPADKK